MAAWLATYSGLFEVRLNDQFELLVVVGGFGFIDVIGRVVILGMSLEVRVVVIAVLVVAFVVLVVLEVGLGLIVVDCF